MHTQAIHARDLSKLFKNGAVAVSGLDLDVLKGSVYGIMGRNGAGKTTLIRMLMGMLKPDQGEIQVMGYAPWHLPDVLREKMAYVSQSLHLPGWMSVQDLIRYSSHFYKKWDGRWIADIAPKWEIPMTRPVNGLSGGQKRMVSLLLAMASNPEILLLDEPGSGLDPVMRKEFLSLMIDRMADGSECTILFSTHQVSDLEKIATHVGIMDRGRILSESSLDHLIDRVRRVQMVFDLAPPSPDFLIPGSTRTTLRGPVATAIVPCFDENLREAILEIPGARVDIFAMNLEEIFIELLNQKTGSSQRTESALIPSTPMSL